MQHENASEILIIRNTCVNRLYDVVKVDFFTEEIEYIVKAVDFIEAVGIVEEIEGKE